MAGGTGGGSGVVDLSVDLLHPEVDLPDVDRPGVDLREVDLHGVDLVDGDLPRVGWFRVE